MITFEDLCKRTGKTTQEVREIIKGEYKIEIVVDQPNADLKGQNKKGERKCTK